jgi:hypothetical protein
MEHFRKYRTTAQGSRERMPALRKYLELTAGRIISAGPAIPVQRKYIRKEGCLSEPASGEGRSRFKSRNCLRALVSVRLNREKDQFRDLGRGKHDRRYRNRGPGQPYGHLCTSFSRLERILSFRTTSPFCCIWFRRSIDMNGISAPWEKSPAIPQAIPTQLGFDNIPIWCRLDTI